MKVLNTFKPVMLSSLFLASLLIVGCGQQSTSEKSGENVNINKDQVKENVTEIVKNIPSPYEITLKLDEIGASYIENAINPLDKIKNYFTEKNKALNLGVYGADLAYVSTYSKKQETSLYASNVRTLAADLNISIDIAELESEDNMQKIENKDTLVEILSDRFYKVYDFLNENSDPALAALVATGLWVEGLYIAMQISEETFQNNEFVAIIYNQHASLKKLIELLDLFKDEEMISAQKNALIKLEKQFESTNGSLTLEQLKGIGQTISIIRSTIVD